MLHQRPAMHATTMQQRQQLRRPAAAAAAPAATRRAAAAFAAAAAASSSSPSLPPRSQQQQPDLLAATAAALSPLAAARALSASSPSRRPFLRASASSSSGAAPLPDNGSNNASTPAAFLSAFWKFLRPHTIRGTILGTSALTARALLEAPNSAIDWSLLPKALWGLFALLCGNGYIVGINQIYDVSIDAINKPFLPVASGELSPFAAWVLCALLAVGGVGTTCALFGSLISSLYAFGLFLGTIYSVPPLRLKRFAVPAFLIIATVRGGLLNFGVYYATRAALGLSFEWSPCVSFITAFVTLFATVIAITKDLPDVDGDRANGVSTFATRLGVPFVATGSVAALALGYVGAACWGLLRPEAFAMGGKVMVGAHATLLAVLLVRFSAMAKEKFSREAVVSFYRWIWTLFYSEYALLCFL